MLKFWIKQTAHIHNNLLNSYAKYIKHRIKIILML